MTPLVQKQLRTVHIKPNENISFSIGTVLSVKKYYDFLGLSDVFGKHKKKGIDVNSLLKALFSYKLTENQSIRKAFDWITRREVLDVFDLDEFKERTLFIIYWQTWVMKATPKK